MELTPELIQLLGFFLGLGVLYGGLRADLKRLHAMAVESAREAKRSKRRFARHVKRVEEHCPHSLSPVHGRRQADRVSFPEFDRRSGL